MQIQHHKNCRAKHHCTAKIRFQHQQQRCNCSDRNPCDRKSVHLESGGAAASGRLDFSIADDDATPPAVTVAAGTTEPVAEGAALTFTLAIDPAPPFGLTVKYTVVDADGADFVAARDEGAQTVAVAAGETTKTVTVATVADAAAEADGPVALRLNAGAG